MASRLFVMRLNSVDLPTLGRPTMAMTGFIARAPVQFGPEGKQAPPRVATSIVVPTAPGADHRLAVGGQPQQQAAVGAVEEVHLAFGRSPNTTVRPD
jgi:hypothetical protein